MTIRSINDSFGDRVTFASLTERTGAIDYLGYMPDDGLVEGRDYETVESLDGLGDDRSVDGG